MPLATIDEALKRIRRGEMVLVVDDEDRENEGDLTMAACWVTPEAVNFMLRWARGLVCMPCDAATPRRARLLADGAVRPCGQRHGVHGVDRPRHRGQRHRCRRPRHHHPPHPRPRRRPSDFQRPGHVFPLRARDGGVLERRGHTEAAVDLARLAGLPPVAVICEVLCEDGSPARFPYLERFASDHRIAMVAVDQLVEHRLAHDDTSSHGLVAPLLL